MTVPTNRLREAFEQVAVRKVAIVDDGYDPPVPNDITEEQWLAFREVVDESEDLGALSDVITDMGHLGAYGDLTEEQLSHLWSSYNDLEKEQPSREKTDVDKKVEDLFRPFNVNRQVKLQQLRPVEQAVEDATGSPPKALPSSTEAQELVHFDLIFLDFYLGKEEIDPQAAQDMQEDALEKACAMVKEVREAVDDTKPTPLFVIISGYAREGDRKVESFRDKAQMLASKFRFLEKGTFASDKTRMEYVLRQLVLQRKSGNSAEQLLKKWRSSTESALEEMLASVRKLDVTDYAYIQNYRLNDEQVSLLQYLTWLYNSFLSSLIEEKLASVNANIVAPLKLKDIPPANLPPMSEVPRIYSKVTTTQVQSFDDGQTVPVWTGDLFVRRDLMPDPPENGDKPSESSVPGDTNAKTAASDDIGPSSVKGETSKESEGNGKETEPLRPDILAVVTPACDLVLGHIKAKSVLLIGGRLHEMGRSKTASNHLLVLNDEALTDGKSWRFQIEWDEKWPHAFPISAFDGEGIKETGYRRVGRLRELYAAEIGHLLSADMARVGVPAAPPFAHALHIKVVVKQNSQPVSVLDVDFDTPVAWELYSSASREKREIVFTEQFLWRLRDSMSEMDPDEECRHLLEDAAKLRGFTKPFPIKTGANAKTEVPGFGSKIFVKRVQEHPSELTLLTEQAVIVLWAAGPTAPTD